MRTLLRIAAALWVLAASAPAAAAEPGGLSRADLQRLRTSALPVTVPGYVPPGFTATVLYDKGSTGESYVIRYRAPDGRKFDVHVSNGGYGDPGPDYTSFRRPFTVTSKALGPTTMRWEKTLDSSFWSSDMVALGRKHGARAAMLSLTADGTIPPDELKRIYASLKPLPK